MTQSQVFVLYTGLLIIALQLHFLIQSIDHLSVVIVRVSVEVVKMLQR